MKPLPMYDKRRHYQREEGLEWMIGAAAFCALFWAGAFVLAYGIAYL